MKGTEVPNPRHSSACIVLVCSLQLITVHILFCSFLCTVCSKVSDSLMLALCILFCSCLCTVCSKVSGPLLLALCILSRSFLCSLLICFILSHACHVHSDLLLPMQSLLTSFWHSFTGLVQVIFNFPSWFHTIWFYCSHTFHSFLSQITLWFSFGPKDMITAFTYFPSYRYSSFTLWAHLCWRHTYCQWPKIECLSQEQNGC